MQQLFKKIDNNRNQSLKSILRSQIFGEELNPMYKNVICKISQICFYPPNMMPISNLQRSSLTLQICLSFSKNILATVQLKRENDPWTNKQRLEQFARPEKFPPTTKSMVPLCNGFVGSAFGGLKWRETAKGRRYTRCGSEKNLLSDFGTPQQAPQWN